MTRLLDHEREALTILAEECTEVAQAICKALRHGLDHPVALKNMVHGPSDVNADHIRFELSQVHFMVDTCVRLGLLEPVPELDMPNPERAKYFHYLRFTRVGPDPEPGDTTFLWNVEPRRLRDG